MKVLFVDIDGVLVNRKSLLKKSGKLATAHPDCVKVLNHILKETGAKIVVSSTWRFGGLEYIQEKFKEWNVAGEVIGITPTNCGDVPRGHEIGAYLLANPEITKFAILDDDSDMSGHIRYLVQTKFEIGLTMEHASKAIVILQDKNERTIE